MRIQIRPSNGPIRNEHVNAPSGPDGTRIHSAHAFSQKWAQKPVWRKFNFPHLKARWGRHLHRRKGLFEANAAMSNEVRSLARSDRYTDTHASQAGSAQWCRDVATALRCGPGTARVAGLHSRVCLPHAHAPGAAWGLSLREGTRRFMPCRDPLPTVSPWCPRFLPHFHLREVVGEGS